MAIQTFDVRAEVLAAEERIREHVRETPLEFSPYLSNETGCRAYLKLENLQRSGSFKLRGAMNKLLSLGEEERTRGVVTASSGNHGMACAVVFKDLGIEGTIYLPQNASPAKIEALQEFGAQLELHGDDCVEAELFARARAENEGLCYVSPYNDPQVVGGQGTIAIELLRQLDSFDTVIVPVGGGGLISGIAGYLKTVNPAIEIIGCQPANSAVLYESLRAGHIVELESKPTLSDGTAGGVERNSITFGLCRDYVDEIVLLTEEEIRSALRLLIEKHSLLAEGSGVLSLAALLKLRKRLRNKTVVCVVSGARLAPAILCELFR